MDRRIGKGRRRDQHGWQGSLDRQRVHRTAVAQCEVRRGLSARIYRRHRGTQSACPVLQLLQHTPFASITRLPDAGRCLLRGGGLDEKGSLSVTAIQQAPVPLPPAAADRAAGIRLRLKDERPSIKTRSEQSIYPTQKSVLRTEATPVGSVNPSSAETHPTAGTR